MDATADRAPALSPPPAASTQESVPLRTRIAVGGALLGAFMAVLNIQVVNTSLPDIQGGIGAGLDDGGWISTAYLIGEIIVIPLSGWLSDVFSLRRYLIGSTVLFLLFSAACGLAANFPEMVVLRGLQGFSGGVLIPLALTCVITLLPPKSRSAGFAAFALTATFAPAIGPTIGGYLTDAYGWRSIFFLNLAPGVVMLAALNYGLDRSPADLSKFRNGDFLGVISMAIGLAALQIVLEEGNKDDWLGSPFIAHLSIVAVIGLVVFVAAELKVKAPVVNLRLFAKRNFFFAGVANVLLGFVLYSAVYLLPIYLSQAQGFSAQQAGLVMAWIGLPQLVLIPLMPRLMRLFDVRWLLAFGFVMFAASCFMNMNLDANVSGPQFLIPNLVRAVGQACVFPPLSMIATAGIAPQNAGSASSLFNVMRNLGGAIGIAVTQTFITDREKFHSAIINPAVSLMQPATQARIAEITRYFMSHGIYGQSEARADAIVAIGRSIQAQAYFLAYGDAFALLGVAMLIAIAATFCLRKVDGGGGAEGAH